jgi:hypothetical protein
MFGILKYMPSLSKRGSPVRHTCFGLRHRLLPTDGDGPRRREGTTRRVVAPSLSLLRLSHETRIAQLTLHTLTVYPILSPKANIALPSCCLKGDRYT